MIARVQRIFAFVLLASAVGWLVGAFSVSQPLFAAAGVAALAIAYAVFMAAEFVILWFVQNDEAATRPTVRGLVAAWWGEVATSPRVFLWRQPFLSKQHPDHLPAANATHGRRGVVLVHGFFCNRGLWNPWMRGLRQRDIPFVAVNLEPVFGSIDDYAHLIEAAVARVHATTGLAPVLVGHSMGGLAIRAWAVKHGGAQRAHRTITIGTPHHGTWLARSARSPNGLQMRLASPWLKALATAELAQLSAAGSAPAYERFICFFGHCDNIVYPATAATLVGARNVHLPGTAHVHMAYHPDVFEETLRCLV